MIIVGLTGAMASGKSTVLSMFKELGAVTISADHLVHLMRQKGTDQTKALANVLGSDVLAEDGGINSNKLSDKLINDPSIRKILEQVFYPSLKVMMKKLIQTAAESNQKIVILEIPCLFESDFLSLVDTTVLCAAGEKANQRALKRENMTKEKLQTLNSLRLKEEDLKKLAKNIINTDVEIEKTRMQTALVYADLLTMVNNVWPNNWAGIDDIKTIT
ncbi:MAG: dephospho-CoA kinase [Proteobacteria bacterium]|nr:dephospho-CoA kinase [Pseudomonadota bacterium]